MSKAAYTDTLVLGRSLYVLIETQKTKRMLPTDRIITAPTNQPSDLSFPKRMNSDPPLPLAEIIKGCSAFQQP